MATKLATAIADVHCGPERARKGPQAEKARPHIEIPPGIKPARKLPKKLPAEAPVQSPPVLNPEEDIQVTRSEPYSLSQFTLQTVLRYGDDFAQDMFNREQNFNAKDCLKRHSISSLLRAKMVDWMVEVLSTYECEDATFFLALAIMDSFSKKCSIILRPEDLHILGVTAMFIASKFIDYRPIMMITVEKKIAQGAFFAQDVKEKEKEILGVLEFDITFPTVYTFLDLIITNFTFLHRNELKKQDLEEIGTIRKIALFMAKMVQYEYSMLEYTPSLLATALIYYAVLHQEVVRKWRMSGVFVEWVKGVVGSPGTLEAVEHCAKSVEALQNCFASKFPSFTNLEEFAGGLN